MNRMKGGAPLSEREAPEPPLGGFFHLARIGSGAVALTDERGRIRLMHEVRVRIRWRDIDNYGHVNNAVYLNYLEECRDRLVEALFGADEAWDFVLARVAIDYRRPLTQTDEEIGVRCGVAGIGNSSVRTWEQIVLGDGSVAAESESVIVPRDRLTGRSRPLTDRERIVLQSDLDAGRTLP